MATQIMGFLKIMSISIKVMFKNGTSMALITTLSLLLSSTIILLLTHSYHLLHSIIKSSRHSSSPSKLIIYFIVSLTFFISYALNIHASTLASVLASATSYETNAALSPRDLLSLFKSKWRSFFSNRRRRSRSPMHVLWCLWIVEIAVACPVAMFAPNPVSIATAGVLVASFLIFFGGAAAVVAAVEDGSGCEAAERAEGEWFSGLALNLSFNAALVTIALSFWWNVRLNVMVYGLFFANCGAMANVVWSVVYTVYYLRSGEYYDYGETVQQRYGGFYYSGMSPNHNLAVRGTASQFLV